MHGVIYHKYENVPLNTTLVSFSEKRRVLSTLDGVRQVRNVGNVYVPDPLSTRHMTLGSYDKFVDGVFLRTLGLRAETYLYEHRC